MHTYRNIALHTIEFVINSTDVTTIGDRAFPVAAARVWNGLLPQHVRHVGPISGCLPQSLQALLSIIPFRCCACEVTLVIVGHINRFFLLTYLLTYLLIYSCVFAIARGRRKSSKDLTSVYNPPYLFNRIRLLE